LFKIVNIAKNSTNKRERAKPEELNTRSARDAENTEKGKRAGFGKIIDRN